MTKTDADIQSLIQVQVKRPSSVFSGRATYSTLFLIHAFDVYLDKRLYDIYVNSYIDDHDFKHFYERPLFILLKVNPKEVDYFNSIDRYLTDNKNFKYTYCVGMEEDAYLYMYVFECPAHFAKDYDLFIQGKYSEFSEDYKKRFNKEVSNPKGEVIESPIYGILYKTPDFKKKIEKILSYSNSEVTSNIKLDQR